jgi:hypothetical protein
MCDIGGAGKAGVVAPMLAGAIAKAAAATAVATVKFRAVFAIAVSLLTTRGGKRRRKLALRALKYFDVVARPGGRSLYNARVRPLTFK